MALECLTLYTASTKSLLNISEGSWVDIYFNDSNTVSKMPRCNAMVADCSNHSRQPACICFVVCTLSIIIVLTLLHHILFRIN